MTECVQSKPAKSCTRPHHRTNPNPDSTQRTPQVKAPRHHSPGTHSPCFAFLTDSPMSIRLSPSPTHTLPVIRPSRRGLRRSILVRWGWGGCVWGVGIGGCAVAFFWVGARLLDRMSCTVVTSKDSLHAHSMLIFMLISKFDTPTNQPTNQLTNQPTRPNPTHTALTSRRPR